MRVLHLDPDRAVRADLAAELEASGHSVESAESVAEALARDAARRADLVVTEVRLSDGSVLDLLRRLHLARGGALPPIAVLAGETEPGLAELCARAGVRRFLRKADDWPVNAAELHGLLLELEPPRRPAPAGPAAAASRVFRGSLDSVDLVEVVQLLNLGRKSGTLLLYGGSREGRLHLREGDVIAAACGAATGTEAFRALLGARGGSFRFEVGDAPVTRTIHEPTGSLLLDALRREDEEGRASAGLGALEDGFAAEPPLPSFPAAAGASSEGVTGEPSELPAYDGGGAGFTPDEGRSDEIRLDDPEPAASLDVLPDGFDDALEPGAFDPVAALSRDPFASPPSSGRIGRQTTPPPAASPTPPMRPEPPRPGAFAAEAASAAEPAAAPPGPSPAATVAEPRPAGGPAPPSPAPVRQLRLLPEPHGGIHRRRRAPTARVWLVAGGAAAALAAGYAVHTAGARSGADAPQTRVEDVQTLLLEAAEDQARIDSLEALVQELREASRSASDVPR